MKEATYKLILDGDMIKEIYTQTNDEGEEVVLHEITIRTSNIDHVFNDRVLWIEENVLFHAK